MQRGDVVIDACMFGGQNSALLQQACHLTGGIYTKPNNPAALLHYLLVVLLLPIFVLSPNVWIFTRHWILLSWLSSIRFLEERPSPNLCWEANIMHGIGFYLRPAALSSVSCLVWCHGSFWSALTVCNILSLLLRSNSMMESCADEGMQKSS